jgi:hypothetical protein
VDRVRRVTDLRRHSGPEGEVVTTARLHAKVERLLNG